VNSSAKKLTVWQKIGMFFYTKRPFTLFIWLSVVVLGIMSYTTWMRKEGFPAVSVPIGIVQVVSFDKSASEVDATYAEPILGELKDVDSVKDISTTSTDQGASLVITFEEGTDVQSELDGIKADLTPKLPQGSAQVLYIKLEAGKLTEQGDDLLISVHKAGLSPAELDKAADRLVPILKDNLSLAADARTVRLVESVDTPGGYLEQQVRFDRYFDKQTGRVEPASVVAVKGLEGVDQLELYNQVEEVLKSEEVESVGASVSISADFAESIREQVSGLQRNLLEGLIAVLIVSFILISLRGSVITALAMTTTVLTTIATLNIIGYTINTITLFSLVLCLALIVDDTTIMVEAIDAGLKKGDKFKDVVRSSFRKVARASATGTFVTILAFAPMLFIGGILGEFIRAIPVTIIISLMVSLAVSFLFIPLMMRLTYGKLKGGRVDSKPRFMDKVEGAMGNGLSRVILWSGHTLKRKIMTRVGAVILSLVVVVSGAMIFTKVEFNIFPSPKDGNEIYVQGSVVDGGNATIENTEMMTDKALAIIKTELGDNLSRLTLSGQGGIADRNGFFAAVLLTPLGERDVTSVDLAKVLQARLAVEAPGMRLSAESAGVGPPAGAFAVDIAVNDEDRAYKLAEDMKVFLSSVEIKRIDGTVARLKDPRVTPRVLVVRNGEQRVIRVGADFYDKDTSTLVLLAQEAVEEEFNEGRLGEYGAELSDISFDFGQEEENQDSFNSMGQAALPLFMAMFLLMALLFRSLIQPVLIFTALPFAFFGVASGLFLTNNPISFFSMLGVFALIGISLNNTILLTDYANQARSEGKSPTEAIAVAVRERLRPLLTTSITSVLALLPLALNDPFWEGLAYALIFGLLSSTVLVLLVFPYFYLVTTSFGDRFTRLFWKIVRRK
jgi:multidrug efflux pump subunit AcrB